IPKAHLSGSLGTAWWRRWPKLHFASDWLELRSVVSMDEDSFWQEIGKALREFGEKVRMAMVYIHGYNTGFKEAALRAAQIGFDIACTGPVAFFSWPSRGTFEDYKPD